MKKPVLLSLSMILTTHAALAQASRVDAVAHKVIEQSKEEKKTLVEVLGIMDSSLEKMEATVEKAVRNRSNLRRVHLVVDGLALSSTVLFIVARQSPIGSNPAQTIAISRTVSLLSSVAGMGLQLYQDNKRKTTVDEVKAQSKKSLDQLKAVDLTSLPESTRDELSSLKNSLTELNKNPGDLKGVEKTLNNAASLSSSLSMALQQAIMVSPAAMPILDKLALYSSLGSSLARVASNLAPHEQQQVLHQIQTVRGEIKASVESFK